MRCLEGGGCGQSSEEVKVKMFLRFLRRKSVRINTRTLFDKLAQARRERERKKTGGMAGAGNRELFISSLSYLSVFRWHVQCFSSLVVYHSDK